MLFVGYYISLNISSFSINYNIPNTNHNLGPPSYSLIENEQIPITLATPPPLQRPYFKMDDTKLRQTVKTDTSGDFYTSFTEIRQPNENKKT
jgi:hypothetical protein